MAPSSSKQVATTCAELDRCIRECSTRFLLIKFGAPWCKPCCEAEPRCAALAAQYPKSLSWVDVDCGESEVLLTSYGIATIPAYLVLRSDGSRVSDTLITGLGHGSNSFEAKVIALMEADQA